MRTIPAEVTIRARKLMDEMAKAMGVDHLPANLEHEENANLGYKWQYSCHLPSYNEFPVRVVVSFSDSSDNGYALYLKVWGDDNFSRGTSSNNPEEVVSRFKKIAEQTKANEEEIKSSKSARRNIAEILQRPKKIEPRKYISKEILGEHLALIPWKAHKGMEKFNKLLKQELDFKFELTVTNGSYVDQAAARTMFEGVPTRVVVCAYKDEARPVEYIVMRMNQQLKGAGPMVEKTTPEEAIGLYRELISERSPEEWRKHDDETM